MVAIKSDPSFLIFGRKYHQLLILLILMMVSCKSSKEVSQEVSWKKDVDNPGIQYRCICYGKNYNGSKFNKWKIEVFNDYTEPLSFKVVICNDADGKDSSEIRTMIIPPSNLREITFYNSTINCHQKFKIKFFEVQIIP